MHKQGIKVKKFVFINILFITFIWTLNCPQFRMLKLIKFILQEFNQVCFFVQLFQHIWRSSLISLICCQMCKNPSLLPVNSTLLKQSLKHANSVFVMPAPKAKASSHSTQYFQSSRVLYPFDQSILTSRSHLIIALLSLS